MKKRQEDALVAFLDDRNNLVALSDCSLTNRRAPIAAINSRPRLAVHLYVHVRSVNFVAASGSP